MQRTAPRPPAPPDNAERLLDAIEARQRGIFANVAYGLYRGGTLPDHAPATLLAAWRGDLADRRRHATRHGYADDAAKFAAWLAALDHDPPAALDYCAFIRWRESLPPEERQRLREARGAEHQRAALAARMPSPAQEALIRSLGYDGHIGDMAMASALITILKAGGRVTMTGAATAAATGRAA